MTAEGWRALLAPPGGADPRAARVVDGFARRRALDPGSPGTGHAHWDARFFGLQALAPFKCAAPEIQQQVLDACGEGLLWESWYIEQGGIALCARMALHAEDLATRTVYALIGADEAIHAHWIWAWLARTSPRAPDSFNRFIAALVETGEPQALCYLLQIVLEGFGIQHYRILAEGCREPALAQTLRSMMADEGLHHAGGLALFHPERLSARARGLVLDAAAQLTQMIRIGPQAVVSNVMRITGASDPAVLFEALNCEAASNTKLGVLRALFEQPGMQWLTTELERLRLFVPCSSAECAQVFVSEQARV